MRAVVLGGRGATVGDAVYRRTSPEQWLVAHQALAPFEGPAAEARWGLVGAIHSDR